MRSFRNDPTSGDQNIKLRSIPNDPTYNIDRFVGRNGHIADQHQRPPLCFGRTEAEDQAIAKGEVRASALLREFDTRFSLANRPPHQ